MVFGAVLSLGGIGMLGSGIVFSQIGHGGSSLGMAFLFPGLGLTGGGMALFATMMASESNAEERSKNISAAKIQICKSAKFVGQQAVQLHGGIGVTEECHAGHYYRRLSMIEMLFGDLDHHLARLAGSSGLIAA